MEKNIIYAVVAVVVIVIIISLLSKKKDKTKIVLFYRKDCPHCVNMKPEWDKFRSMDIRDKVELESVDIYENTDLADKFVIKGVPAIIKIVDGKVTKYEGPRTAESFYRFALFN